MPAPQQHRIAISLAPEDRARVHELAAQMHMRPATYIGWLVTNIVRNLEAAETVAEALSRVAHTIPAMDAPKTPGKKTAHQGRSSGLRKASRKGAKR